MPLKIRTLIALFIIVIVKWHPADAQNFTGFSSGNYSGVLAAEVQPAAIADNMYHFDLYLAGASAFATNNYFFFYRKNPFLNFIFNAENDSLARGDDNRYGFVTSKILLPSAMLSLKNDDAIGFSASIRTMALASKVSGDLASDLADEFGNELYIGIPRSQQEFKASGMSWQEYGITYARKIIKQSNHTVKAGITLKMIIGNAAFYTNVGNFNYVNVNIQRTSISEMNIDYGYSDNLDDINNDWQWKVASKPAPALDLGVIYEHRLHKQKTICPTYDGSISHFHEEKNIPDYQYKIGVALLDVGRIKYNYGTGSGRSNEIISTGNMDLLNKMSIASPEELIDSVATFANVERNEGNFTIGLPTSLRLHFDYHINKDFYVEAATLFNLSFLKFSDYTPGNISYLTIIPRWEKKWISAYMPLYSNVKGQVNWGLGFRIGPLIVGVNDIMAGISRKKMESQGFYIALKTFFFGRKTKQEILCEGLGGNYRPHK